MLFDIMMLFLFFILDVEVLLVFLVGIFDFEYVVELVLVWLLVCCVFMVWYCIFVWCLVFFWFECVLEFLILWDLFGVFSDFLGLWEFEGFCWILVIIVYLKMDDNRVSESDRGGNRRMGGKGCIDISYLLYVSNNLVDNLLSKKLIWYLKDGEWSVW